MEAALPACAEEHTLFAPSVMSCRQHPLFQTNNGSSKIEGSKTPQWVTAATTIMISSVKMADTSVLSQNHPKPKCRGRKAEYLEQGLGNCGCEAGVTRRWCIVSTMRVLHSMYLRILLPIAIPVVSYFGFWSQSPQTWSIRTSGSTLSLPYMRYSQYYW